MVTAGLRHPAFARRIAATYHFVDLPEELHEAGRRDLANCDTVLIQDIANFDDYPLRAAIPARAQTVSSPCLRLASLWPFDSQNGPGDAAARARAEEPPVFTHFDGLLARLRTEIPDPEDRYQAYRSLAVDGLVNFRRMHQFEERRLNSLDSRFRLHDRALHSRQFPLDAIALRHRASEAGVVPAVAGVAAAAARHRRAIIPTTAFSTQPIPTRSRCIRWLPARSMSPGRMRRRPTAFRAGRFAGRTMCASISANSAE